MSIVKSVPSVSVTYSQNGASTKSNELGMRAMQERAYEKRGEQYLLIKSPPASGKSRALMFIALDKLYNQGVRKAIITVPEKSIGSSFADEALSKFGFWSDWTGRCCTTLTLEDSHRESMQLDRRHEQAIARPLPHHELVQLHCGAAPARFSADLAGQAHDVASAV